MLYDADQAEDLLFLGRQALRRPKYRKKLGLPAIRVGKRLVFDSEDVDRIVEKRRERFGVKFEEEQLRTAKQGAKGKA